MSSARAPVLIEKLKADTIKVPTVTGEQVAVPSTEPMRGARILLECLLKEGADTIFGYPGGAILHVYDELAKMKGRIRHVLVRHEQGAVHAAEGFARSTG